MADKPENQTVRVFFALWPAEAEQTALASWQRPLGELCGGRAMRVEALHLTLVFIGQVELYGLEVLEKAAREARGEPFSLTFDVARYWGHNHIVYAAPSKVPSQLSRLVKALERCLESHHFVFDKRPYKPHITLLRHARWTDEPLPDMPEVVWRARDFALVQSVAGEEGTRYQVLARFPLG